MVTVLRCRSTRRSIVLPMVLVSVLMLSACTLRLISEYDDRTDIAVSELQTKVDGFLVGLEKTPTAPGCTYDRNKQFYVDVTVDIGSLRMRNEGRPKNDITVKQLELLADSLKTLEELHSGKKDKCMLENELEPIRSGLNTSFAAILKLELAKKRGK